MARCEDCIHYEVCYDRSYSADWCKVRSEVEKHCEYFKDDSCLKKQIPGKWVMGKPLVFEYHCSKCKFTSNIRYKFCPNCGADMRGKKR